MPEAASGSETKVGPLGLWPPRTLLGLMEWSIGGAPLTLTRLGDGFKGVCACPDSDSWPDKDPAIGTPFFSFFVPGTDLSLCTAFCLFLGDGEEERHCDELSADGVLCTKADGLGTNSARDGLGDSLGAASVSWALGRSPYLFSSVI